MMSWNFVISEDKAFLCCIAFSSNVCLSFSMKIFLSLISFLSELTISFDCDIVLLSCIGLIGFCCFNKTFSVISDSFSCFNCSICCLSLSFVEDTSCVSSINSCIVLN